MFKQRVFCTMFLIPNKMSVTMPSPNGNQFYDRYGHYSKMFQYALSNYFGFLSDKTMQVILKRNLKNFFSFKYTFVGNNFCFSFGC